MMRREHTSDFLVVLVLVLMFWVVVLLLGEDFRYILVSGVVGLAAWLLRRQDDRDDATRQHELETSRQRVAELEAERLRSHARIKELEVEAARTAEMAAHWATALPGQAR